MRTVLRILTNLLVWPFRLIGCLVRNIGDAIIDVDAEWNMPGDMPWKKAEANRLRRNLASGRIKA